MLNPEVAGPARIMGRLDAAPVQSVEGAASAVSWGAIIAGAAAAAALSMLLLMLGVGLGLSSVSPWVDRGASATAIGISSILWLTFTQLAASGMGGYLAGRLRTRWAGARTDEVYFRDTAHGFLAWAMASLATAALLGSTISTVVGAGAQAGAAVAGGAATVATAGGAAAIGSGAPGNAGGGAASSSGPMGYFLDSLYRTDASTATAPNAAGSPQGTQGAQGMSPAPTAEVGRIFATSIGSGNLPPADLKYVGQTVAQRTGLSQQDAEKRVADTYAAAQAKLRDAEAAARDAADKARKASAYAVLWMFISLLVGAFIASLAATYGGRRRDL
ncbi:hypothetical protein QTI66_17925 [Variovorax sp. J22R133]|uniref:hypothetical protein n=1 Tax=Variovorax brevis TaxID=3053503 RepID=UPI0025780C77|nr:hypothetical protein [Variovorax sp. J22R133]MDM0114037.1 hypothetical protein [Variovorax sp. J22R133]